MMGGSRARGCCAVFWGPLISRCEREWVIPLKACVYLVLYWLVAPSWGEVLGHGV